ncbi:MAG: 4Fe-4S binding protein [Thermodesulfovibrionales bacterium]|nr:4Fe-4S binding protein [Thermodesulfovibrionales bacterium]
MKNLRRLSQALFLLIFLFLFIQTESKGKDELGYPVKIFLDFDPLLLITTLLSAHTVEKAFYLSLILIFVTAIFGRVFCGWICPLGTLNNIVSTLKKPSFPLQREELYKLKYYILIFFIVSSFLGIQITGILDPLSFLIRSLSISIYPAFNYMITSFFDSIYNLRIPVVIDISEYIYSLLKRTILLFQQSYYKQGFFIGFLFISILALNFIERRFWCKYLCPLGALLGILSTFSLLKRSVSEGCTECGKCATICQSNALPDRKNRWRQSECLFCWNCDDICPNNAVSFGFSKEIKTYALNLGRRRVLMSTISAVAAVPILKQNPLNKENFFNPLLIRPPGAQPEKDFLKKCVRCGECMKVCLTNGLQPTFLEAGLEGLWTPILIPKIGYCEYRCTLCGQVCPTGAIKRLSVEEKTKIKIGLAMIDKGRCIPYAHKRSCIVCEEVCPTPKKAIWFEKVEVVDKEGLKLVLLQPHVDLHLCIGCGICETKCPVVDKPAIYVTSIGESRSKDNQLIHLGENLYR